MNTTTNRPTVRIERNADPLEAEKELASKLRGLASDIAKGRASAEQIDLVRVLLSTLEEVT